MKSGGGFSGGFSDPVEESPASSASVPGMYKHYIFPQIHSKFIYFCYFVWVIYIFCFW